MKTLVLLGVLAACSNPAKGTTPTDPVGSNTPVVPPKPKAVETPALYASPLPNDPTKTTIHRLSNGMTVYISPDSQEPTITAHIAVRAGGRHDPKQSTGLAHYLEHMLFKGTSQLATLDYSKEKPHLEKIAALYADLRKPNADHTAITAAIDTETQNAAAYAVPNEHDQLYARMGITNLNAYTTTDATVYTVDVPKNRIAQWARVEGQRFADPVFRLFWPELEAVYEEKNASLDDPEERVYEALIKHLFPEHGYGWGGSVLGEVEHLKSPAYQDMLAFFDRYYTPGNIAILLAGDVEVSILPVLEKELGSLKRPAGDAVEPGALPKLAKRTEVEVPVPSDEGVVLAWSLPSATHADALAIELMDLLLLDGQSGILSRDLIITQRVAAARSDANVFREAGYYELAADALDGQSHAELEQLLLELVGKLQRGDFTELDIATAILTAEVQSQQLLESNAGRMTLLTTAFVQGHDWRDVVTRIERMKKLTKADVVRVAKQYLTAEYVAIKKVKRAVTPAKITKPPITPVKLDTSRQTVYAKSILGMPVVPIEPVALVENTDYKRGAIASGEVITVPNKRNGLFTVTFDYAFGRVDDRLACAALNILPVSGAGKRTAEQVARHLHEHGLSIDTACTKDETRITLSGIDRNLEAGMTLLREWLAEPMIDDATVKARIATALTERMNSLTSPQSIQTAQMLFAQHGADSELLIVPTNKQLKEMKPAQLKKLLVRLLDLQHRTAYFGPRTHDRALAAIILGTGKIPARAPRPARYRKITTGTVFATHQDTAQTHIMASWPRKPTTDADRAPGKVFSEYAALLLYQEVREARGLAYTVYGAYDPGSRKLDDASVYAYAGVQGDKTHDALDAILATLRLPIDDKRLDTAKETLAQNHRVSRIAPRSIAASVYAWQDQGEKSDPRAARMQRAMALEKAALAKWLTDALALPAIFSLTGSKEHVDATKVAKLGPITWVPVEKLFGY